MPASRHHPVLTALLLAAALFSVSCKSSSKPQKLPKNLPKINVSSSASSPRHSMSRGEYPFDERGNYVTAWAAEGSNRSGSSAATSSADYASWRDSHGSNSSPARQPVSVPVKATSKPSRRSTTMTLSSTAPTTRISPPAPAPTPARTASSPPPASRPPTVTTTSTAPKKPAPAPVKKPAAPATVSHTVKSGDTLYGIALRYKSTVAKIKAANGLQSDLIHPGKTLRVPR